MMKLKSLSIITDKIKGKIMKRHKKQSKFINSIIYSNLNWIIHQF